MHKTYRNVNEAFSRLVNDIVNEDVPLVKTTSRAGEVLQITEPVIITYDNPLERVLFNEARDANPFFHLMESLWMLAGRNDVRTLAYYNSQISNIASDDGKTFNGAYGYRWHHGQAYWGHGTGPGGKKGGPTGELNQLAVIINELRRNPGSRRCVLTMWNVGDDLQAITTSKDVCCNTHAYFLITNGALHMTVCNRSNDLVWGMLGANVVHFSFLLEYMAANIGVSVGQYHQVTNNLHVYTERWSPKEWISDITPDHYANRPRLMYTPLVKDINQFHRELNPFVSTILASKDISSDSIAWNQWQEPFLSRVALPAALAWNAHRRKDYHKACEWAGEIIADDWRIVCTNWIRKRQANWERNDDALPAK